jgi:hypothetical protein
MSKSDQFDSFEFNALSCIMAEESLAQIFGASEIDCEPVEHIQSRWDEMNEPVGF